MLHRSPALLAAFLLAISARAAVVEVTVRERDGLPVAWETVSLERIPEPGDDFMTLMRGARTQQAGADGKARFESVAIGTYRIGAPYPKEPGFVPPGANPFVPAPVVTIAADGDQVQVTLPLWRGAWLRGQATFRNTDLPMVSAVIRSLDGPQTLEQRASLSGRIDRLLPPGRYEVELRFPAGFLLDELYWNGAPLPGYLVRFDVNDDLRDQNIAWYLHAPSLFTGTVLDEERACGGRVVATLRTPGTFLAAAQERGGSSYAVVTSQFHRNGCVYELWLPDGTWELRAERGGPAVVAAIAPGESQRHDFVVPSREPEARNRTQPLIVVVASESGRPIGNAVVEVRKSGTPPVDDPLRETTEERGLRGAAFEGLPKGSYRVAAGHAEFLENAIDVPDFDPDASEPTVVRLALREGARIRALAREGEQHVSDVELHVTRLDALPEMELMAPAIRAGKQAQTVRTDATGYADVKGLYGGSYRLTARMTGELAARRFVRVRAEEARSAAEAAELTLTEGERTEVALAVVPAAALSGRLQCSDHGSLPPRVALRVLEAAGELDPWSDPKLGSGCVLATDDFTLTGRAHDVFAAGPLPAGTYVLAVQPEGSEYWSFPPNQLVPEGAFSYRAEETSTLETGANAIECGPVALLTPVLASAEAVPDLRPSSVRAFVRTKRDETTRDLDQVVETHAQRAFVRRLEEGEQVLGVEWEHPYLIPARVVVPPEKHEFLRGKLVRVAIPFERVGGLVELIGDGLAGRLTSLDDGRQVVAAAANGTARFPGTIPGAYRAEMCRDAACAQAMALRERIEVAAAATLSVR